MSKTKQAHWTEGNIKDFLYRIASDFVEQIQERMREKKWTQSKLAKILGWDKSRISQLLNNPGNLGLETIIKLARALELKVSVVAYDDGDKVNSRGPINAEIFRTCWQKAGKPADVWEYRDMEAQATIGVGFFLGKPLCEYGQTQLPNTTQSDGPFAYHLGRAWRFSLNDDSAFSNAQNLTYH
jgi:transcriptional regulator with XRE-family HTH domain